VEVSRITAANYLNKLADDGLLRKEKIGTGNYYVNDALFDLINNENVTYRSVRHHRCRDGDGREDGAQGYIFNDKRIWYDQRYS